MTTQQILQGVHDWTNGKIVYDISVAHPDGQGKPTPYADLAAALGTGGANIPEGLRKGGMSVKFIQGTVQSSDNKYIQARCMAQNFTTDTTQWQGVDDNALITSGSELVTKDTLYENSYSVPYSPANCRINTNGVFSVNTTYKHIYLPVVAGEKYHIDGIASYVLRVAFAITNEATAGDSVPVVTGTSVVEIPAGTSVWVKIPAGCTYLLIWRNDAADGFTITKTRGIDSEPNNGSKNLVESGGTDNKINQSVFQSFGGTFIPSPNKIYRNTTVLMTGELTPSQTRGVVIELSVISGYEKTYINGYHSLNNQNADYVFYDENNTPTPYRDSSSSSESYTNREVEIPVGTKYIRIFGNETYFPSLKYTKQTTDDKIEEVDSKVVKIQSQISGESAEIDVEGQMVTGSLDSTTGEIVSSTNGRVLSFACNEGENYKISGYTTSNTIYASLVLLDENGVFSIQRVGTAGDSFTNVDLTIPPTCVGVRLFGNITSTLPSAKQIVESIDSRIKNIESRNDIYPQIYNNILPIKSANEELNILLIGSSWGVDTITALADICHNLNVPVNTGNLYKSGGTIANYLDLVDSGGTTSFYYNSGGTNSYVGEKTVEFALGYKTWDVIVIMNAASQTLDLYDSYNEDIVEWLGYLKTNCPSATFAINSTWTEKDKQYNQNTAFEVVYRFMKQTGINLIIPSGTAINYLRKTSVNDGNDIYRDNLHINVGIGRFTTACASYMALVYPIFKVSLANCTLNGKWDAQGNISNTYPVIEVSSTNRSTCIECAVKANANRFMC